MKHIKHIDSFIINEAARIGNSSWSSILRDLKYDGWDIKSNSAYKSYEGDDGDERKLELSNYGGDEVEWTIYDGKGKEINSGSFDAEGLSAGELDSEVWSNIEESVSEAKDISIKDYKVGDVISFKDGEDWKVTKVKYDKLMVKPHNEKAKKANTSIEIDIDLDYLKNNLAESTVNEGRTIEKIEKDRTKVVNDMAEIVTNWKAAKESGDKKAEASFLQRLKDLTAQKKGLEKELNIAIAGKDRDVELVISESVMSEIDLLAREAKNFKDFLKAFKTDNRYKGLDTAGDAKEFEDWLKSIYDNAKNESMNEAEDVKKGIHDHWKELYNEDFISTYPKVAKILKNRQNVDRRELARIWDETYGEDFKEKYAKIWDVLD